MRRQMRPTTNRTWLAESMLIFILVMLTVFMLISVEDIQGSARVVNYTGILQGGTQRLVRLELSGQPNDELMDQLTEIMEGLERGGGTYNLSALDSREYQDQLEFLILLDLGAILYLLLRQTMKAIHLGRSNRELNQTAYTDGHTGLLNKSRCEQVLSRRENVTVPTCCMMFDLNDLKKVNDGLGHIAGDTLILNFAHILRRVIPEQHFLGRYGGDEFVAVLEDSNEVEVQALIRQLREEIGRFNADSRQVPIHFAGGCALSTEYRECTLEVLLGKADHRMYRNKREVKAVSF